MYGETILKIGKIKQKALVLPMQMRISTLNFTEARFVHWQERMVRKINLYSHRLQEFTEVIRYDVSEWTGICTKESNGCK